MEIKVLRKYDRSRLNKILIRQINVYSEGRVKIVAEDGSTKEFYVDEDVAEQTADYIICDLQGEDGIKVSKY